MQNRTQDISRQYWTLNDQYRLLNSTIVDAVGNHQKIKDDYETNVSLIICRTVENDRRLSLECPSKFEYHQRTSRCDINPFESVDGLDQQSVSSRTGGHPRDQISS